jgi:hypothetical protein
LTVLTLRSSRDRAAGAGVTNIKGEKSLDSSHLEYDGGLRLLSLWDIMNTFDVANIAYRLSVLGAIEGNYAAMKTNHLGGNHLSMEDRKDAIREVSQLAVILHNHNLMECRKYAASCIYEMSKSIVDVSGIFATLHHFREQVLEDFKARKFLLIDQDRSDFVDAEHLFGDAVSRAFPSAVEDIRMAGNCLATECCTACVFHLMRAVEHAIRALANDRRAAVPKVPIELATWEQMFIELEKAETAIQQFAKALARDEQLKFYHGAMMELRAFKNYFRNAVRHTKDEYDRDQAKSATSHVGKFMEILSGKISEQTQTPVIWV